MPEAARQIREALAPSQRSRRFVAEVQKVIKEAGRMSAAAQRETLVILQDLRRRVVSEIAEAGTEFGFFNLGQVKKTIDEAVAGFSVRYGGLVTNRTSRAWEFGMEVVDLPFEAAGVGLSMPSLPTSQLEVLRTFGTDLVTGLSQNIRKKLATELTLASVGAKTPFEAQKAVQALLKTRARPDGTFAGSVEEARRIVRTELGRAQSVSTQVRLRQFADAGVKELKKQWNGCRQRAGHLALNGKAVPQDEPFTLVGADGTVHKPMFPRDPVLPPAESVNCAGDLSPFKDSWEEFE